MKYIVSLIIILTLCRCSQIPNSKSVFDQSKWVITSVTNTDNYFMVNDTVLFNSQTNSCHIGNKNTYQYVTNDSLLVLENPVRKILFLVEHQNNRLTLNELYETPQILLTLESIN